MKYSEKRMFGGIQTDDSDGLWFVSIRVSAWIYAPPWSAVTCHRFSPNSDCVLRVGPKRRQVGALQGGVKCYDLKKHYGRVAVDVAGC